jgi:hypothetical protein
MAAPDWIRAPARFELKLKFVATGEAEKAWLCR